MSYQKSKTNLAKFLGKNPKHIEWLKFWAKRGEKRSLRPLLKTLLKN